jgi:hypothetical protein
MQYTPQQASPIDIATNRTKSTDIKLNRFSVVSQSPSRYTEGSSARSRSIGFSNFLRSHQRLSSPAVSLYRRNVRLDGHQTPRSNKLLPVLISIQELMENIASVSRFLKAYNV